MKSILAFCCSLIAAAAANVALAGPFDQSQLVAQAPAPRPEPQPAPAPPRDMRAPGESDHGRMNPDERRQLRRDIQNAGRDIYRPAPPQRRDAGRSGRR